MTQLFPILIVAVVLFADHLPPERTVDPWLSTLLAVGPVLATLALAGVGLRRCLRRLDAGGSLAAVATADRIVHRGRWVVLVGHAVAVLLGGWLDTVRGLVGDLVLLDELIALGPPVAGAVGLWWLHYPVERRVREALLIRRLDGGRPIYAVPSRASYVGQQVRVHLLILLVPVLLILGLAELIDTFDRSLGRHVPGWSAEVATFVAAMAVFVTAPVIARLVLTVERLADGDVRRDLEAICARHAVRVRDYLLWRTDGSMVNAAVMGLVGPLRYVLLTDGLLDAMERDQVRAVMAHEIGHVKRHHMPWLVVSLLATLIAAGTVVSVPLLAIDALGGELPATTWVDGVCTAIAAAIALLGFGWISRRYERQADTFAVQHLSGLGARDDPAVTVEASAVQAMQAALASVAQLNTVDPHRRSWRHGSIAWRQAYLATTIGLPVDRLPIDRLVRRLKIVVAATAVVGGGATIWLEWNASGPTRSADERPATRAPEPTAPAFALRSGEDTP